MEDRKKWALVGAGVVAAGLLAYYFMSGCHCADCKDKANCKGCTVCKCSPGCCSKPAAEAKK